MPRFSFSPNGSRSAHPSLAIATSSDVRSPALSSTAGVCSQSLASPPAVYTLPSLHSILSVRVPSLHHVPKAARDMWARLVGELLSSLASDPADADSWSKFFMLAKCVLISPPGVNVTTGGIL